ncbi:MAG: peptide-methionine (S)-S-oxide reductase [Myxococcota bacterium]|jgi:peptide-methionine (S)-S-oxide reductase
MFGSLFKARMVTAEEALPGRDEVMPIEHNHVVLGNSFNETPLGHEVVVFGMGCFWGAERFFWKMDGVYSTSVGYAGGFTKNPTYREVCTGKTGHTEVARVVYDPKVVSFETLLKTFWENHDPTQGMRQGNDRGSQYRSSVFTSSPEQLKTVAASEALYQEKLTEAGMGEITTEIGKAGPYYFAEAEHQQYLHKNPGGYCNHGFNGVSCPIGLGA